jgi:hypothetical protein
MALPVSCTRPPDGAPEDCSPLPGRYARGVPEDELHPIGESVDEALLRILRPDLLDQYREEKERHREELRAIERARRRALQMIRRLFGGLRERKQTELEQEYAERVQGEDDRHARFLAELRETIRGHRDRDDADPKAG